MNKNALLLIFICVLSGCSTVYTVKTSSDWETASPESQGLNTRILSEVIDEAENTNFMYSVLVIRNGFLVVEDYFNGAGRFDAYNVFSVTKSYISALVGIALREKYLENLDQKMMDFFPEYVSPSLDKRTFDITLRHLLMMRAGFDWDETEGSHWTRYVISPDWIKHAVELPLRDKPGEKFNYCSVQTNILSAILTKASGMSTLELAEKFLFAPLQTSIGNWNQDPQDYYLGGYDMYSTPRDMARFGYLFLNNGFVDGNQIIPAEWVEESVRNHGNTNLTWWSFSETSGYGYLWWTNTIDDYNVYYANGMGGQRIMIVPDLDMIIVTTTDGDSPRTNWSQNQAVMELIDYLLDSVESK